MVDILMIAGKMSCIILIAVLVVLILKTSEYFNELPANDKNKPLISWNVLMLFIMLISRVVRLITW